MDIPCPNRLKYLPFQKEAIEFAIERSSVLLGDEMGLGKTVEAIGFLNCHPEVDTLLVVCPASLRINWAREISVWLISPCVDITIINYDILSRLDMKKEYDVVIFDEFHYLKSRSAKRSRLCRQIRATYKLGLTGSPLLNRPKEAWHLLHILDPVAWPMNSYNKFAVRYCNGHMGFWGWDDNGFSHLDELRELLKPLMIRRLKSEVLKELPAKRRQVVEIPGKGLSAELKAALSEARGRVEHLEDTYKNDVEKLDDAVATVWMEMAALRHSVGLAKVPMAVELITDALESGEKIVVFAHHRDVVEGLCIGLTKYCPVFVRGDVSQTDRQYAVDRFQTDKDCRVFIGNIQAAGTGITLTASSHVIFVEMDWTPGVMSQAEDRVHRIGQRESVLVQHLVLEGSLDAYMAKRLVSKQEILDKILN